MSSSLVTPSFGGRKPLSRTILYSLLFINSSMFIAAISLYYLAIRISSVTALPIVVGDHDGNSDSSQDLFPTNIGYLGPTRTAGAPFLAQTNAAAAKTGTPTSKDYILPQPIETSVQSSDHSPEDRNIFELFGTISPYYVSDGWGVYDYAMPGQCKIDQVHVLSRHGTRYNTRDSPFASVIGNAKQFNATGDLEFLNQWEYDQGVNILTTLGNQQLFDKGARTFFRYGRMYDWNNMDSKMVVRSTTQERMTMSAEYFLIGFFGTNWQKYVNLELIIEEEGFNNSLATYEACPNNNKIYELGLSKKKASGFLKKFLGNATDRFNSQLEGLSLEPEDVYYMQELCTFEAVTLGYSQFCKLFTQEEWEDYEYYNSWVWYNANFYGAQTSRALGISWVEEFYNRITNTTYDASKQALQNSTLNKDPIFFPLDQKLYMDFTHDSTITNIYSALGFEQFKSNFSDSRTNQPFDLSKVVPFASQSYFEIITCDDAVPNDRSSEQVEGSGSTKYIHVILNDHTLDLHENVPKYCEARSDGWCELSSFLEYMATLWDSAEFHKSCFGDIDLEGEADDGVPV
ncbi:hypothetical protein DASC09_033270 [Saccharomycopsis crataegensis]|uniref:3-phytase n=1 Tax=Saccharomycopsis crataegensis TaxID=43959 RepID=A0AAV5QN30_9ASCO|nr:hypothetical protein DASC09_033270 [Saccharomycopsis crataegensis]